MMDFLHLTQCKPVQRFPRAVAFALTHPLRDAPQPCPAVALERTQLREKDVSLSSADARART